VREIPCFLAAFSINMASFSCTRVGSTIWREAGLDPFGRPRPLRVTVESFMWLFLSGFLPVGFWLSKIASLGPKHPPRHRWEEVTYLPHIYRVIEFGSTEM